MTINGDDPVAQTRPRRRQDLVLAGGLLGALAACSCCIVPLLLFSVGVSGAWIGNLTALAPYQPYFIAATLLCLGYGFWLGHRAAGAACRDDQPCARPLPGALVKGGFIVATVLVLAALAFDVVGPLVLPS